MRVVVSIVGGVALGSRPSTGESVAQETGRRWFVDLEEGATVGDLMSQLGLRDQDIQLALLNGQHSDRRTALHEGDAVAFTGEMAGE